MANERVDISISAPTVGLVTRVPADEAARISSLKGLTLAQNVRCDEGVLRCAPGCELIEKVLTSGVLTEIVAMHQPRITSEISESLSDNPIIATTDKLWALTRERYSTPLVNAGADQYLLQIYNTTLTGTATDSLGLPLTYLWEKIVGPAVIINTPTSLSTTVKLSNLAIYTFRLTVSNGIETTFDEVQVQVVAYPQVSAGSDQSLTGVTSTTMAGSVRDPQGFALTTLWTQIGGPAATITTPSSPTTTITGLTVGVYTFRLTSSNPYASKFDDVTITVT